LSSSHLLYLSEIKEDALLSASEEKELAAAIARGDRDAKNRMIRANLRLVVKIAREYGGRGLMLDDLIGEGNLGLIRAVEEYDPRFGTRFSTYASYWIKQAIRHALINTTATIRLPAHMVGLMTKWRRMERSLSRQLGFAPSADEVASRLGLTETQKSLIAKARRASHLKLESSFADDGNHWSANKLDDSQDTPETAIEAEEDRRELSLKLERLDDRERAILNYRFGLDGESPLTLKEVGKRLGVTREWVRKIEIRALRKLNDDDFNRLVPAKSRTRRVQPAAGPSPAKASRAAHLATSLKQPEPVAIPSRISGRDPLATGSLRSQAAQRSVTAMPSS
jgi:RNA polymerase primary sigma factor